MKKPKKSETRHLPCTLTIDEIAAHAAELAIKVRDHDVIEEEKKSANSTFKARLDGLETEMRRLARLVREKKESRDVECMWVADFDAGRVDLVRQDNGEIVDTRAMTPEDRQVSFEGN